MGKTGIPLRSTSLAGALCTNEKAAKRPPAVRKVSDIGAGRSAPERPADGESDPEHRSAENPDHEARARCGTVDGPDQFGLIIWSDQPEGHRISLFAPTPGHCDRQSAHHHGSRLILR
jgi:hypothetical protein